MSLSRTLRTLLAILAVPGTLSAQTVLVKPYVQPGDSDSPGKTDTKVLYWFTDQAPGEFVVEYEHPGGAMKVAKAERSALDFPKYDDPKKAAEPAKPEEAGVKTGGLPPEKEQHFFKYTAILPGLPLDSSVTYRVKLGGKTVREATFATAAGRDKAIRFAVVGDLANGKEPQKTIAYRIGEEKPSFMMALGDIVYPSGRVNQYSQFYWNTYNDVEAPGPKAGAPLMASIPFYAVLGNHDVAAKYPAVPDALGVYYFFQAPKNGPGAGPWATPLGSDKAAVEKFRKATTESYPSLDAYSFDSGPAHILVLNSNISSGIEQPKLRQWVENDLKTTNAKWKFVCYHAPAFHSSGQHYTEQAMRLWQPIFQDHGVDVIFSGHVHNYQRSLPMRFTPTSPKRDKKGRADGEFAFDKEFDGVSKTQPKGIIHFVAGGGGATLYGPGLDKTSVFLKKDHGDNYADYTAKMIADQHSFVMIDLTPETFKLRALDLNGKAIDQITITKPAK
jgi:predicted phosphodiesterase